MYWEMHIRFSLIVFTPQPSGLEGYCRHGPGGRAGGCQTCGTHISVTAWWIFSIPSSVELSRPVVVQRHSYLPICPIWACPWAKTCQMRQHLGQTLRNPYLWNHWMDLYPFEFYGIVLTCSCATSWSFDLDLGFSRSNSENTVSQEWNGRLTWNKRDVNQ